MAGAAAWDRARPPRSASIRSAAAAGSATTRCCWRGQGESLELRHVAEDRAAFAHGALAAARFLATAPPARYALEDLLQHRGRSGVHR
jgi:4-hydroxy-tetrahydrodipicolinate reductase